MYKWLINSAGYIQLNMMLPMKFNAVMECVKMATVSRNIITVLVYVVKDNVVIGLYHQKVLIIDNFPMNSPSNHRTSALKNRDSGVLCTYTNGCETHQILISPVSSHQQNKKQKSEMVREMHMRRDGS